MGTMRPRARPTTSRMAPAPAASQNVMLNGWTPAVAAIRANEKESPQVEPIVSRTPHAHVRLVMTAPLVRCPRFSKPQHNPRAKPLEEHSQCAGKRLRIFQVEREALDAVAHRHPGEQRIDQIVSHFMLQPP